MPIMRHGDHKDDWEGWGSGKEGPALFQPDSGQWRIVMDRYGGGGCLYATSSDLDKWSAVSEIPGGLSSVLRHGTVLREEDLPGGGASDAGPPGADAGAADVVGPETGARDGRGTGGGGGVSESGAGGTSGPGGSGGCGTDSKPGTGGLAGGGGAGGQAGTQLEGDAGGTRGCACAMGGRSGRPASLSVLSLVGSWVAVLFSSRRLGRTRS